MGVCSLKLKLAKTSLHGATDDLERGFKVQPIKSSGNCQLKKKGIRAWRKIEGAAALTDPTDDNSG